MAAKKKVGGGDSGDEARRQENIKRRAEARKVRRGEIEKGKKE